MPEDKNIENAKAQMRKGTLEFSILLIIAQGEVYASEIIMKLKEEEMIVVEGTLYPILSRLKKSELVTYAWKESSNGPPRKYYSLTASGRETLDRLKAAWQGLSSSINSLINQQDG